MAQRRDGRSGMVWNCLGGGLSWSTDSICSCYFHLQTAVRCAERACDSCLWRSRTQSPAACPSRQRCHRPGNHRCGSVAAALPRSSSCRELRNGIAPRKLRPFYRRRQVDPSWGETSKSRVFISISLSLLTFAATLSNLSSSAPPSSQGPKFVGRDVEEGVGNGCIVRAYENFTLIDN